MLLPNTFKLLTFKLGVTSRAAPHFWACTQLLMTSERPFSSMSSVRPANRWCITASWDEASNKVITTNVDDPIQTLSDGKVLDLTTSPDWMEFVEITEHRSDEGGAGAYDSFRCDLILGKTGNSWRIWGQEFHLNRIEKSYRSIASNVHVNSLTSARQKSEQMVRELLQRASMSPELLQSNDNISQDFNFQLLRMTLLWSNSNSNDSEIMVRGHCCSSGTALSMNKPTEPIVVSVSAKKHGDRIEMDTTMPSRAKDPQHKVASWTRLRKQMEHPQTYKPPGVAEVLMLRQANDKQLEVLEGLSSNVFVIYKDGTLRTASDGVLHGYARHLVLECAESCGMLFDPSKPIILQDAEQGLWQEAFITSSSRLLHPISKVLLHTDDEFVEYWKYKSSLEKAKWQQLFDEIIRRADAGITPV